MNDDVVLLGPLPEEGSYEVDLWDEKNPRSLINLVWEDFRAVMKRSQLQEPDLFLLSESRMIKKVDPDPVHRMLRLRFWQEYDRAQVRGTKMKANDVVKGICTSDYWRKAVLPFPEKVIYIITPIPQYLTEMEDMLNIGLQELREILALPIKGEDFRGKQFINTKLIAEKIKIFQLLDLRVKGAVIQKIAIQQRIDQTTTHKQGEDGIDRVLGNMNLADAQALEKAINNVQRQIDRAQSQQLLPATPETDEALTLDVTPRLETIETEKADDEPQPNISA